MKRLLLTLCVSSFLFATSALGVVKGPPSGANFSMTIDDFMSDGTPTAIRGDGAPYVNGVDGVSISSMFLNFWPRTDLGTRNVTFGNNGFVEASNLLPPKVNDTATPPSGTTGTDANLTDPHGLLDLATSMPNMAVSARQCGTLFIATHDNSTGFTWRLVSFQGVNANGAVSSYVVVTRISSTQWTVESDNSNVCSSTHFPNEGIILHDETTNTSKGKTTTVTYADGYYSVPLHLTYTLQ